MSIRALQPIFDDRQKKAERKLFVRYFSSEGLTLEAKPHIEVKMDSREDNRLLAQIENMDIMVNGVSINQMLVEMDKAVIQRWKDTVNPGRLDLNEEESRCKAYMMSRFSEVRF